MTAREIIDRVCEMMGVTEGELRSADRRRLLGDARAAVSWLVWHHTNLSTTQTGALMGRHHSTVMYGRDKVDGWLKTPKANPEVVHVVRTVAEEIRKEENL